MRSGRRWWALGAIALVAVAVAEPSDACTIIVPSVALPRLVDAPPNAHVWLQGLELSLYGGASFVLVAADDGAVVPADLRGWETSMLFELAPKSRLRENARYEVWGVPTGKGPKKPPVVLGTFRTNATDDTIPPSPPTIKRAQAHPSAMTCPPFLTLEGSPGTDAGGGEVLHAVWLSTPEGLVPWDAPPDAVFAWRKPTRDEPRPEPELTIAFRGPGKKRLGVRTVDVAGHLSVPIEVDVAP